MARMARTSSLTDATTPDGSRWCDAINAYPARRAKTADHLARRATASDRGLVAALAAGLSEPGVEHGHTQRICDLVRYISWYLFRMAIYVTPEQVSDALGDKIMHGFSSIVIGAATDLAEYRRVLPAAVSRASGRGLANWIHDAMRARARAEFDGLSAVSFTEHEPHFDAYIASPEQTLFRVRFKRHTGTGRIANVRTQGALDFVSQPEDLLSLLGMKTVHLCVGYEWDSESRSMSAPVMTLRDGSFEDAVWMIDLPTAHAVGVGTVISPVTPIVPTTEGPALPTIEVAADEASDNEGSAAE